jgi:hypothetical protein
VSDDEVALDDLEADAHRPAGPAGALASGKAPLIAAFLTSFVSHCSNKAGVMGGSRFGIANRIRVATN